MTVAIVGGGLAGLACARRLAQEGVTFVVLEAAEEIGGRVRTEQVDGFLLDRGFQALLTGYPDAERLLDYDALELGELYPGALVRIGGRFHRVADPFRRPRDAAAAFFSPVATMRDYPRLARLRGRARTGTVESLFARREMTALELLRQLELSSQLIERFFRPFLGAVFLERRLTTSSRMVDFAIRMFSLGATALPAGGMGAIPRQLADDLPEGSVRTKVSVETIDEAGVVLSSGERIETDAVVVATDGSEAARLGSGFAEPSWRSVTCLYFAAEEPPLSEPILVLGGDADGPVNHLCVPSNVAPSYAPEGAALVSASVLGTPALRDEELEMAVREQLSGWLGRSVAGWRHLRTYRIERALPALEPPCLEPIDRAVRLRHGLYICGDHRETASIEGALASGRRAGQAVAEELGRS